MTDDLQLIRAAKEGSETALNALRCATAGLDSPAHGSVAELEEAIDSLEESHREVVLLRRFEELSYPESGARLGKSPDAARMLYTRAMAALTLKLRDIESAVPAGA